MDTLERLFLGVCFGLLIALGCGIGVVIAVLLAIFGVLLIPIAVVYRLMS